MLSGNEREFRVGDGDRLTAMTTGVGVDYVAADFGIGRRVALATGSTIASFASVTCHP